MEADKVKECSRLIRDARSHWSEHSNSAARRVRSRAMAMYETLTPEEKDKIPQVLRQWLRYRSEFYLGRPKKKRKNAPNPVPAMKKRPAPRRASGDGNRSEAQE